MKILIINGPSGSGKTTLSKNILCKLNNAFILNTVNYYKTGINSRILSRLIFCYFDRKISFNFKLFKEDLENILKNKKSAHSYIYDFKNKKIKKEYEKVEKIKFLIIEGIFSKETIKIIPGNSCILIQLEKSRNLCMQRVIERDSLERGKSKYQAKEEFLKSWKLHSKKDKNYKSVKFQKKIFIKSRSDEESLIKNIFNLIN